MQAGTIEQIYEILFQITVALTCGVVTVIAVLCALAFLLNAAEVIADAAHE